MNRLCTIGGITLLALTASAPAQACATCFGTPDDPQTQGMNMAIVTLLGVTYGVFGAMLGTVVVVWRMNRKNAPRDSTGALPDTEARHG